MPPELRKFLLTILCLCAVISVRAQICTGSLGDPVINQDFGSGTNPGPALGSTTTNYTYYSADCPNDGSYTIANRTSQCFDNSWHTLTDHTGNPNGYMMVINASYTPGIFYVKQTDAGVLCPDTKYEFSAWVTNLILPSACNGNSIRPNLTFTIEALDGTVLGQSNTGDIAPTNNTTWQKYGTTFTTPANATSVIVKITNNATGGCGNDLALDDITFRPCGASIQTGFGSVTGLQTKDACIGQNVTVNTQAKIIEGNTVGVTYQWQSNINNGGWNDIPGANSDSYSGTIINAQLGTYQYRVGIVNGPDPNVTTCRIYSQPLTATVHDLPSVNSFSAPQSFCEGTTLSIQASGADKYVWSGPGLSSPTTASSGPLVINNVPLSAAGNYSVTPVSDYGCEGTPVTVQVNINPKIQAAASAGAPVCAGESVQLHASGGLYYKWTPSAGLDHDDIADPVASPSVTTTYSVTISNDACSDNSQSATATIMQLPVADGGGKKVIFEGQSVKLNGTVKGDNVTSVYWTPTTGLDDPTSATPMASPTDDITYTLHVVSSFCGSSTDEVPVKVYKKITVYNAFSPNNDGINDTWSIEALITYPQCSVMVFDRYGKKVYQSTGYAKPWDGTYGGQALPVGTYYYVIDLKNNTPKLSGWVSIIR